MSIFGSYIKYLGKRAAEDIEKKVTELLPKKENITFLDCGCDDGEKTAKRAKIIRTKNIFGIENISERAIKAKRKGIAVFVTDLNQKWPVRGRSIDCITATEVVEHLVNLDNFFQEANRVLKPGGSLIVSTENLAGYQNIFALILGNQPYTGPYLSRIYPIGHRPHAKYYKDSEMDPHINVMTAKALKQLMRFYNFRVVNELPVSFYPFPNPLSGIFAQLDPNHASYVVVKGERSE